MRRNNQPTYSTIPSDYTDVHSTSKKWNIPERRITLLCREGRIAGAYKSGKPWYIPTAAEQPLDGRTKEYAATYTAAEP